MNLSDAQSVIARWKAMFGSLGGPDIENEWVNELSRAGIQYGYASKALTVLSDGYDPQGKKRTLADLLHTYRSITAEVRQEVGKKHEYDNCEYCGNRGYRALVLCGEHHDCVPCRIMDDRDGNPQMMEKAYWSHKIPCNRCRRGEDLCNMSHPGLRRDKARWDALCAKTFTWMLATSTAENWQHYADQVHYQRPLPWYLTSAAPPPDITDMQTALRKVADNIVKISRTPEKHKQRTADLVEEAQS
jgi:hypothetical protein